MYCYGSDFFQVLRSVRTGVSYHGKLTVAICLEDLAHLNFDPAVIRRCVKDYDLGKSNVTKDFVPASSTKLIIKRGVNSYSRKCTVIWLESLPKDTQEDIVAGMIVHFIQKDKQ